MNASLKQRWTTFSARVEALSQRERVMVFGAVLAAMLFIANVTVLGPLLRKQDALMAQIEQQRNNLAGIDAEIAKKAEEYGNDPNEVLRQRLGAVRAERARMGESLRAMQQGLVPPERIAPLLEAILRANGRLKLVSMKTLPVGTVNGAEDAHAGKEAPAQALSAASTSAAVVANVAAAAKSGTGAVPDAKPAAASPTLLYRHGVELTLRGSYLDMVDYMNALEGLPTQLFWGKAQLDVEEYPNVRLTLTLYTLSLDPKWMKL